MSTVTYSLVGDFSSGIDESQLDNEIRNSVITTTLISIVVNGDNVFITFVSTLSGGETTTLNAIVAAHNPVIAPPTNRDTDHNDIYIITDEGISGTGNISANVYLSLDINSLTTDATPDGAADYIVTYDTSAAEHKKVLINNMPNSGETNTASNVGVGGVGVFKQKTGVNLEFKNVNAASSKITVVNDAANNEIDIDVAEANINHNALLNYVANQHIDHTTVSISSGIGLTGGGTIAATRTLSLDINSLTTDATPDAAADFVATYDTSATTHKKVLLTSLSGTASNVGVGGVGVFKQKTGVNLEFKNVNAASSKITVVNDAANNEIDIDVAEANVNHNALLNYVADQHIDHTTVSISAGIGLTGGGTIAENRTLSLNINGLTADATPDIATDYVATYDASAATHKKVLLNLLGQANTASNVGTAGVGVFKQKTGVDLEFKNVNAASSKITVTNDAANNEIDIDVAEANVNHNALLNYVANQHIDHTTVSISAGIGLSGGGTIAANRTLSLDINGLTADATPDIATDYVATYDASATTHKKVLLNLLGQANTASNVGSGGVGVFKQKTGVNLEFKNINAASSKITVTNDAANNEIDIDVAEANVNHNALLNYVANQHIDHTTVSISAGIGLTGGGTIAATRTLSLDINGLTSDATPDGAADFVVTYDASALTHKKVLLNNLPSGGGGEINTASNVGVAGVGVFKQKTGVNLEFRNVNAGSSKITVTNDAANNEIDIDLTEANVNHNALLNYVANQHIDHTAVSISAGIGLTGGGTIAANRTLSLDINGLTTDATPDGAADFVVTYDASAATHKKVLLNNLPISNTIVSSAVTTSTTSTTYTIMNTMSITPAAGTYFVTFSASGRGSATNADHQYALHSAGVIIAHSERMDGENSAAANSTTTRCYYTQAIITVNGAEQITLQYKTSAGTLTVFERSLIVLKVA
jgi:uncharacterized lipoprotein YehR (DUF1307 family)